MEQDLSAADGTGSEGPVEAALPPDLSTQLERVAALNAKGALSDEEYAAVKARLLAQDDRPAKATRSEQSHDSVPGWIASRKGRWGTTKGLVVAFVGIAAVEVGSIFIHAPRLLFYGLVVLVILRALVGVGRLSSDILLKFYGLSLAAWAVDGIGWSPFGRVIGGLPALVDLNASRLFAFLGAVSIALGIWILVDPDARVSFRDSYFPDGSSAWSSRGLAIGVAAVLGAACVLRSVTGDYSFSLTAIGNPFPGYQTTGETRNHVMDLIEDQWGHSVNFQAPPPCEYANFDSGEGSPLWSCHVTLSPGPLNTTLAGPVNHDQIVLRGKPGGGWDCSDASEVQYPLC